MGGMLDHAVKERFGKGNGHPGRDHSGFSRGSHQTAPLRARNDHVQTAGIKLQPRRSIAVIFQPGQQFHGGKFVPQQSLIFDAVPVKVFDTLVPIKNHFSYQS